MKKSFIAMLCALVLAWPGASNASALGKVVKRVSGSVVVILTEEKVLPPDAYEGTKVSAQGLGSGVLISKDGKVLTAAHVVQTADTVSVEFPNGEIVKARVVSSEPPADVALLQLERVPASAVVAKLGDSDKVEVADQVFIIGAPYGISHTLTVGHISARRTPGGERSELGLAEFFQTDAAVNQGNSGGPMFNLQGEVVGVVSYILTQSGGFEGLGFAVTSNTAKQLLLERPPFWSGLQGHGLSGELAALLNVPQTSGLLVLQVAEGSPAARIGLRGGTTKVRIGNARLILGGDIILRVMGIPMHPDIDTYQRIRARLRQLGLGQQITVTVLRAGKIIKLIGSATQ